MIKTRGPVDERSKIVNLKNIIVRSEKAEESLQIQPFVGIAADGTVVKIKAVYVDYGAVGHVGYKKEGQSYRLPKPALDCRGVVQIKHNCRLV